MVIAKKSCCLFLVGFMDSTIVVISIISFLFSPTSITATKFSKKNSKYKKQRN